MIIDRPIITSHLDTDFYKWTMGAVVFHNFPDLEVSYEFINRGKTHFPPGFAERLKEQIIWLALAKMTYDERSWVKTLPVIRPTYGEWLSEYRPNPDEVIVKQTGGNLKITIRGYWFRTILWEVPLMAIVSELYFLMMGVPLAGDWKERIAKKAAQLDDNNCRWCDMGTRRRRSYVVQNEVVAIMKNFRGFVGTSNPLLAFLHKVKPIGTTAHEAVMAMECLYGANDANNAWLNLWHNYHNEKLNIALPDTFTTDVFLRGLSQADALRLEALRQDSGNPKIFADEKVLPFYKRMEISPATKGIVFSDNLNVPKFIDLSNIYSQIFKWVMGGIGTNLSNDTFTDMDASRGWKALNMVIKLSGVKVGNDWIGAVKLSDDAGKHTGTPEDIDRVKKTLKLV